MTYAIARKGSNVRINRYGDAKAAIAAVESLPDDWAGWVADAPEDLERQLSGAVLIALFNAARPAGTAEVNKFSSRADGARRLFQRIKEIAVTSSEAAPTKGAKKGKKDKAPKAPRAPKAAKPAADPAIAEAKKAEREKAKADKAAAAEKAKAERAEKAAAKKADADAAKNARKAERETAAANLAAERDAIKEAKAKTRAEAKAEKARADAEAREKRAAEKRAKAAANEGKETGYAGMRGEPLNAGQVIARDLMLRPEGATVEEVAAAAGLTVRTAGNAVHRTRAKLLPAQDVVLRKAESGRKAYHVVDAAQAAA